jgi:hypothetical protein
VTRRASCIGILLTALALPTGAGASTTIATGAERASLGVDARGNAEVRWTAAGASRTLLVPPRGEVVPGGRLSGPDVSRPAAGGAIPYARAVRRIPSGRLWALQAWRVQPGGPLELRIARWSGAPTTLTLQLAAGRLTGRAAYHGAALPEWSQTFAGTRTRVYVYLDALLAGAWQRIGGVAIRADGTFKRLVPPAFAAATRFRAVVTGPAIGADVVPDALATVDV